MLKGDDGDIILHDETATDALACHLAARVGPGEILALSGPTGAGKSHLARRLIHELAGGEVEVPSPTYTLIQTYDLRQFPVLHADLYRLSDPSELMELGIEDYLEDHLVVVEWPERAGSALPEPDWKVELSIDGAARRARLHKRGE